MTALRTLCLLAAVTAMLAFGTTTHAGPMAGAIFTTDADGLPVNANIYDQKEDVYLDGGPGLNAPSRAAALAEGEYYFMVTDPSGKVLLSSDDIECRRFHVNADGVIDAVGPAPCAHVTGIDSDHAELGALTVQLYPFDDTPNPGGVYKVWVTPVEAYAPGARRANFGFIESWSKMDVFKVRKSCDCTPCVEEVVLPTGPVQVCVMPGTDSYLEHTILGAGALDGVYEAWCVDLDNGINADCYEMTMISSLDPAAADLVDFPENWDLVNYVLNQDYPTATAYDIQNVIWTLLDMGTVHPSQGPDDAALVAEILADALANGEGFVPQGGSLVAIVMLPPPGFQITIIPVLVPECL